MQLPKFRISGLIVPAKDKQDNPIGSAWPTRRDSSVVIEELSRLAENVLRKLGFVLVDVNISQQGKRRVVSVIIYRHKGRISLEDCESVSRQLETILDERMDGEASPPISGPYVLEVASPGIDRVLKKEAEYGIFAGQSVELRLKESSGQLPLTFAGTLAGLTSDKQVVIRHPALIAQTKTRVSKAKPSSDSLRCLEEVSIPLSAINSVRLYPQLSQSAKNAQEESGT